MPKWTLIVAAVVVGVPLIVGTVGLLLPKGHRASRTVTYAAPPATVFAAIADVRNLAAWRSDLTSVEVLPDDGTGVLFREKGGNGDVLFRIEVSQPPTRMVTRIADPKLPFGGSWTFVLAPSGAGTELTITEDGEVYNPIFRVMQKLFFSPYKTIDTYQADLRRHLQ